MHAISTPNTDPVSRYKQVSNDGRRHLVRPVTANVSDNGLMTVLEQRDDIGIKHKPRHGASAM